MRPSSPANAGDPVLPGAGDEPRTRLLGLRPGEPNWRHAIHRRHQQSRASCLRAPNGRGVRLHSEISGPSIGLLRAILGYRERNQAREAFEEVVAGLEDPAHRALESELGRPLSFDRDHLTRWPVVRASAPVNPAITNIA